MLRKVSINFYISERMLHAVSNMRTVDGWKALVVECLIKYLDTLHSLTCEGNSLTNSDNAFPHKWPIFAQETQ
jgi:hypothetical protein